LQALRSEQAALQQGLQQLGRNLREAAERNAPVNREVSSALARANLNVQQTLQAMEQGRLATQQAQQSVEALNRLALSLLSSVQQMQHDDGGAGAQQALPQLADLVTRQGSVNGRSNALTPLNIPAAAMRQQLERLAVEQMEIARQLGALPQADGGQGRGELDALAREAEEIARHMQAGRLPAELLARQERLFRRMLDAGRSLEKDEYEEERTGERPGRFDPRDPGALDERLFRDPTRFRAPAADELQALPPAYRRLILDYFERLNRPERPQQPREP
jgi:hypothetical protein